MPNIQENFPPYPTLNVRLSVTAGVTSGASLAVSGIAAEDIVLGILGVTKGNKVSVTTGVTSGDSLAVAGVTAESQVLEILEITGAGGAAVTGIVDRLAALDSQGTDWLQLTVDTDEDHVIVRWFDPNSLADFTGNVSDVGADYVALDADCDEYRVAVLYHDRTPVS